MKQYHFCKIKAVRDDKAYWYFKPESIDDIKEHWNKYVEREIINGYAEYAKALEAHANGEYFGHYTNEWAIIIDTIQATTETPMPSVMADKLEADLYYNRMHAFNKGDEIYLSEGPTVFMLTEGLTEVIEDYYSDTLEFPHTLNDVRFIQWPDGKHWYAKYGRIDITDENNNQKWDTKEEAEKAADWYLKNKVK